VLAAIEKLTVPFPVPVPLLIIIQAELLTAVQLQPPLDVITLKPLAAAAEEKFPIVGDIAYVQLLAWLTVNVCPAIVKVPVLGEPLFAATVKETAPVPVPLLPAVIVIQETLDAAVQAQPVLVVTLALPLPPTSLKLALFVDKEYEQAAAWLTVNV
jgi:hypothetical protein